MIHLTRLNHLPLVLNSDLIEHIDVTPDTVISLTTGEKIVVLESVDQIVERVIGFRRSLFLGMCALLNGAPKPEETDTEERKLGPAA